MSSSCPETQSSSSVQSTSSVRCYVLHTLCYAVTLPSSQSTTGPAPTTRASLKQACSPQGHAHCSLQSALVPRAPTPRAGAALCQLRSLPCQEKVPPRKPPALLTAAASEQCRALDSSPTGTRRTDTEDLVIGLACTEENSYHGMSHGLCLLSGQSGQIPQQEK